MIKDLVFTAGEHDYCYETIKNSFSHLHLDQWQFFRATGSKLQSIATYNSSNFDLAALVEYILSLCQLIFRMGSGNEGYKKVYIAPIYPQSFVFDDNDNNVTQLPNDEMPNDTATGAIQDPTEEGIFYIVAFLYADLNEPSVPFVAPRISSSYFRSSQENMSSMLFPEHWKQEVQAIFRECFHEAQQQLLSAQSVPSSRPAKRKASARVTAASVTTPASKRQRNSRHTSTSLQTNMSENDVESGSSDELDSDLPDVTEILSFGVFAKSALQKIRKLMKFNVGM